VRIPDEKIEEVRSDADIVEIISAQVKLKKRGKAYLGLCPFHQEKTPSFTVSSEKQMYHCFGCHKGGNVFTFVMETEKVSFVEAVRALAKKAGIELPAEDAREQQQQTEHELLFSICRFAGNFFFENLSQSEEGKFARDYFAKRGWSEETIRAFGLGYSLNSWDGLLTKATEQGYKKEDLLKAGLIRTRENEEGAYDYFRGRAMFPILTTSGRVVGFGARKLYEHDSIQGKYINSPETVIYNKSKILYGLFHSKEVIRREEYAIMVEGYADLISLFQAGVQNVVASSGTALTEEQLQLLGRYSKRITLVYDADSAGSSAMVRGVDLALEQDFDVRVAKLPDDEDPDSFVQKFGGKEFRSKVENAISFIDFKAQEFMKSGAFDTPEGKANAVRSIVQSIAKMKDELKRAFYVREVSEKYGIYESVLHRELERWVEQTRAITTRQHVPDRKPQNPSSDSTDERRKDIPAAERDILKLLLEGNQPILQFIFNNIHLGYLFDTRAQRLAQTILEHLEHEGTVRMHHLLETIEDEELRAILSDLAMSRYELSKGWRAMEKEIAEPEAMRIAKDAVGILKRNSIQREMEQIQQVLRDASLKGIDSAPYMQRQQELIQLRKELEVRQP
jgi:DNA primase